MRYNRVMNDSIVPCLTIPGIIIFVVRLANCSAPARGSTAQSTTNGLSIRSFGGGDLSINTYGGCYSTVCPT